MRGLIAPMALAVSLAMAGAAYAEGLSGFTNVEAEGLFKVEVSRGDYAVNLTGAQMGSVSMRVRNGTLRMWQNDQNWLRDRTLLDAVAHVTTPTLGSVKSTRGALVEVDLGRVDALSVEASTFGRVLLKGHCERLEVKASLDADVNAQDFSCDAVTADATTRAKVQVRATEQINANATWAGEISVSGEPRQRATHTEAAGKVTFVAAQSDS
ncbi:MAG: DUF2807 domain-containing protein [Hyphomonadaceae bacterium]|nr:DUF2807 domain-containing protein [Hyphomonadaceae bacterium]